MVQKFHYKNCYNMQCGSLAQQSWLASPYTTANGVNAMVVDAAIPASLPTLPQSSVQEWKPPMECPPQPIKLHSIHPPHLPPVDHTGTSIEGQCIESLQGASWTPPPNPPTLSMFQPVSSALPFQSSPSFSSFLLQLSSSAEVDTWTPPPQPPPQVPALNASVSHATPENAVSAGRHMDTATTTTYIPGGKKQTGCTYTIIMSKFGGRTSR